LYLRRLCVCLVVHNEKCGFGQKKLKNHAMAVVGCSGLKKMGEGREGEGRGGEGREGEGREGKGKERAVRQGG